ncbi:hypothetical protein CJ030_MR0G007138 [Morella rubra]|uniref:Uncharacterized protein n=1 Tax=Morella rubra TaxID=262757 RepID=A0A6A1UIZ9_9ROSI|nr:hypothetical protein CJ030_MR0G007138 [Morella rubra]
MDPPHLHDHYSPNDEDKTNEDPPSLHDHYSLNDENTNEEDPPNITFRHSWLNVGIMLPPAWGGAAHQMPLLQLQLSQETMP